MKKMSISANLSTQDRFGRQLAARLDTAADNLSHDISERLRIARLQALGRHRQVHAKAPAALPVGGGVAALGGGDGDSGFWSRVVALVPLLALIAGLVAIQILGTDQLAEELADIDAAILADDLPPDAYADPGFTQFLKTRLDQRQQD